VANSNGTLSTLMSTVILGDRLWWEMESGPASYGACYQNGVLQHDLVYLFHRRRRRKRRVAARVIHERQEKERESEWSEWSALLNVPDVVVPPLVVPRIRKRRAKSLPMRMTMYNGEVHAYTSKMSLWYTLYVNNPQIDNPSFLNVFRARFRLPYEKFLELVEKMKPSPFFQRWQRSDATNTPSAPLSLLLLGVLRILGRSWTFCDVFESTGISRENVRQFFHVFIKWGRRELFAEQVKYPVNAADAIAISADYEEAGFHGCVGSTDATHVMCDRIPVAISNLHRGYKLPGPARTYNLTCDHRRRILYTTAGFPARYNDKSLIRFDRLANKLKNGEILEDRVFELKYRLADGTIGTRKFRGCWLLVDNGYIEWSITIPPVKTCTSQKEKAFSEMLESLRKDVECTFGILKGRWRYLKTGIRLQNVDCVDDVWFTCCALHNLLLDADAQTEQWETVDMVDADEELGQEDFNDIPFALRRLRRRRQLIELELESVSDVDGSTTSASDRAVDIDDINANEEHSDDVYNVRDITFASFRSLLVNHFTICGDLLEVKWPQKSNN
jgi:DDE superfamily endonuclease